VRAALAAIVKGLHAMHLQLCHLIAAIVDDGALRHGNWQADEVITLRRRRALLPTPDPVHDDIQSSGGVDSVLSIR
jgi:hypothetical protein